ncbi:MAG: GAF domain-containing protein [Chloroflexi bacterium]|nr:GAF domain-containing protein [Chloroflexota bacterium]
MTIGMHRLKWLTAILVTIFLLTFEYLRHVVWPGLLHTFPAYLLSLVAVFTIILVFNQVIYDVLEKLQQNLLQQNRRLSTLNAIASTVSQSLNLDETLNDTLDKVIDLTGVDAAAIYLAKGDHLFLKAHHNFPTQMVEGANELKIGEGLSGQVAASGQPIIVQEKVSQDARLKNEVVRQQGFESYACVPLLSKGKVVGVLPMATYRRREFSTEEVELLGAVGHQIGVAIENAQLHSQVRQQAGYLNTLIESSGNAIITVAYNGTILSWNHAAEIIYGWSKDEAVGQVLPMVPPHLRDESRASLERLMGSGETIYNLETLRLRKDRELIPVMVTASPIRDAEGQVVHVLGISTDMRDRKRLEQELLEQQRALAVLQERERLARELHDSLGQILGYVNTQSQAIRELLSQDQKDKADSYLKRLIEVAQDAHADIREYILSLQTQFSREHRFIPTLREYLGRPADSNSF